MAQKLNSSGQAMIELCLILFVLVVASLLAPKASLWARVTSEADSPSEVQVRDQIQLLRNSNQSGICSLNALNFIENCGESQKLLGREY